MNTIELERVEASKNNSFACCRYSAKLFERSLHVHPEIEIVYISSGEGECIVADNNIPFNKGDIFVFGSYLPHYFKSRLHSTESSSIYIQFIEGILPSNYTSMPGCTNIKLLLHSGSRGVKWHLGCNHKLVDQICRMQEIDGFDRLSSLYNILDQLGQNLEHASLIASASYTLARNTNDSIYHRIIEYINLHFREHITLSQLAKHAHMNSSAMCRYFKSKAGQSIFNYLLDVRIAIAKEELATTDNPIAQIAYEIGFSSISYFNTQFKKITNITPSQYRQRVK
ncbi:MAG: AraC family transcriptional regulator [Rikenellaceae bacterium]